MANFISGLAKKATDNLSEATNSKGGGILGQFSGGGDSGVTPPDSSNDSSGGTQDYAKGARDAKSAFDGFSKTRKAEQQAAAQAQEQEEAGKQQSNTKKIGGFFKSAFKYGSAASKAEKAGEELTGENLKSISPFNQQKSGE